MSTFQKEVTASPNHHEALQNRAAVNDSCNNNELTFFDPLAEKRTDNEKGPASTNDQTVMSAANNNNNHKNMNPNSFVPARGTGSISSGSGDGEEMIIGTTMSARRNVTNVIHSPHDEGRSSLQGSMFDDASTVISNILDTSSVGQMSVNSNNNNNNNNNISGTSNILMPPPPGYAASDQQNSLLISGIVPPTGRMPSMGGFETEQVSDTRLH